MTRDRLALIILPFAVLTLLGAQDCGDVGRGPETQPVLGELARRLEEFLQAVRLVLPGVIPPPGWFQPEDGARLPGPEADLRGFSIRGGDRPRLNPGSLPAVVEIYQMDGSGFSPHPIEKVGEGLVGSDYVWRVRIPLYRGDNLLGARTRVGGHFSDFTVIRVVSETGAEPPTMPSDDEARRHLTAALALVRRQEPASAGYFEGKLLAYYRAYRTLVGVRRFIEAWHSEYVPFRTQVDEFHRLGLIDENRRDALKSFNRIAQMLQAAELVPAIGIHLSFVSTYMQAIRRQPTVLTCLAISSRLREIQYRGMDDPIAGQDLLEWTYHAQQFYGQFVQPYCRP